VMISMGDAGWTDAGLLIIQHYIGIRGGSGTGKYASEAFARFKRGAREFLKDESGALKIPAGGTPKGGNKASGKTRWNNSKDADEALEGLQGAKQKHQESRPSNQEGDWEGAKIPKQNAINSDTKSRQRADFQRYQKHKGNSE